MSESLTLEAVLAKLQAISADKNRDYEVTHGSADDLLEHTIWLLALPGQFEIVKQILTAYNNVGKWYA